MKKKLSLLSATVISYTMLAGALAVEGEVILNELSESDITQSSPDVSEEQRSVSANEFMRMMRVNDPENDKAIISLLEAGTNPNTRSESNGIPYGDPALYIYINSHGGSDDVVKAFIDHGVDVMWMDAGGDYKIIHGLFFTNEDVLEYALDRTNPDLSVVSMGRDVPITDFLNRDTPFFSRSGNMETSLRLLDKIIKLGGMKYDHDNSGDVRNHVLKYALSADRDNVMWPASVLQRLIDEGAEVNVRDKYERTPLYYAARKNAVEHIKVLARNGADMNVVNKRGSSVLIDLIDDSSVDDETLKTLIDAGTDVNLQAEGRDGLTALIAAVTAHRTDLVGYLLKHGANPDLREKNGRTALMLAVTEDDGETGENLVNMLLAAGASTDIADDGGFLPLSHAVQKGSVKTADLLVSGGADLQKAVNVRIPSGKQGEPQKTLYDIIMESDRPDTEPMREYLKDKLGKE